MGSRDLWHDSSFSGREVRGISGRKPKQHIHSFHTYKTDNNNAMASDTAAHCNKSAVTILDHSLEATLFFRASNNFLVH